MRLVFTGADPERYLEYRGRILAEVGSWAKDRSPQEVALVAGVLDFKFGIGRARGGDGRLGLWRRSDLRGLLLEHLPRGFVGSDPGEAVEAVRLWFAFLAERGLFEPGSDDPAALDRGIDALLPEYGARMADPARFAPAVFWANEMRSRGIDPRDEDAAEGFLADVDEGLVDVDVDVLRTIMERDLDEQEEGFELPQGHVLPVVPVPADDEADAEAESNALVGALRALVGSADDGLAVGRYRQLAPEDARALERRTGSVIPPQVLVGIAAEVRIVRADKGRLVPVKRNRGLLDAPARLFAGALSVMPRWDSFDLSSGPLTECSITGLVVLTDDLVGVMQAVLYRDAAEGWTERDIADTVLAQSEERTPSGLLGGVGDHERREAVEQRVRRFADVLEEVGAVESFEGPDGARRLRATPLGRWALRHSYRSRGFTAYSREELAAEPAELVLALIEEGMADDGAVRAWTDARSPEDAAAELLAVARRTDDPVQRSIAMTVATRELGGTGLAALRGLAADPEHGAPARTWLVSNGFADMDSLSPAESLAGMLDVMETLMLGPDEEGWEADEAAELTPALLAMLTSLPVMVAGQSARLRDQARRVAEWVSRTHPDPEVASAARSALSRI